MEVDISTIIGPDGIIETSDPAVLELKEKWGFGLIDLWNSEEMNAVSEEDYAGYMSDGIHPNRTGYIEWWTPAFEKAIVEYMK